MSDHKRERLKRLVYKDAIMRWRVSTLWQAVSDIPTEEWELSRLDSELDEDRWFKQYVRPTARNVLLHCIRICEADLSYPIIVWKEQFVLDGMHRLAKASLLGHQKIAVKHLLVLPESDMDDDQEFFE